MSTETTTTTPGFGTRFDPACPAGMATLKNQVESLLNINCVVALDTLQQLGAVA